MGKGVIRHCAANRGFEICEAARVSWPPLWALLGEELKVRAQQQLLQG